MSTALPTNTPIDKFFKYSFTRLDDGDVRSLEINMKEAYINLCKAMHGCRHADAELENLYGRRYVELEINMSKMHKLGLLFQRLAALKAMPGNDSDDNTEA